MQVTYNGYVDTTGLRQMDWRITDALHDPPGLTERYHSERLYRLPSCNWCYRPDDESPEVGELPALRNGYVTFGCLNKAAKMSPPALRLWSQILAAVPGSRLMVPIAGSDRTNTGLGRRLESCGIPGDRLDLMPRTDLRRYLGRFNAIDIGLDPFPFNGITTTCDSLWLGCPVVTLAGRTHASRGGVSLLTAVGLEGLIARTAEQYVHKAVTLANDLDRLRSIRSGLRERVNASELRNETGFTRRLEAAYRAMWVDWCERPEKTRP